MGITWKKQRASALEIWFGFMELSRDVADGLWRDSMPTVVWQENLRERLCPRSGEAFEEWQVRLSEDLHLLRGYELIEHRSVEDFKAHFVPDFYELHLTVNLYADRRDIVRRFLTILTEAQPESAGTWSAMYQPNAVVDVTHLSRVLNALRAKRRGLKALEIAKECGVVTEIPKGADERAVLHATVSRYLRRGKELLVSVANGQFPNPKGPRFSAVERGAPPPTSVYNPM
jgi:hypothetical protein